MPSKTTTLLLLAGLATASADIYMVHFADTDDNVEMVTVFNNGCIKAAEGRYARYHCDESAGALAVAYYGVSTCASYILYRINPADIYTLSTIYPIVLLSEIFLIYRMTAA